MRDLKLWMILFGFAFAWSALAAPPPTPEYELVLQAPPATGVNSVTVSPDGSLVATAAGEGGVRIYDARGGQLVRAVGGAGDRCVVFSPDGKMLTAAGFHMDKLVSLWDVQTGKRLQTFAGQTEWEADATAISPDGKLLASTGVDKQILVWEIATGKLRHQLKDQPTRLAALAFSPDSATLATGGGDKVVRLWDMATGKPRQSLTGQSDWICALAFSPDGKLLATGSCQWGSHRGLDWPRSPALGEEPSEWRVWEIATGKLRESASERGRLLSLAFSPDSRTLAYALGKEVRLRQLDTNSWSRTAATHDADVTSVAFTPDGAALLSASHDQTVKRTNLATGKLEWQTPGYFEQVNSVALSQDGTLLVTGSGDHRFARGRIKAEAANNQAGAIRLWDLRTGRMLRRLGSSSDQIMAVSISSDGRLIAAGGETRDGEGIVSWYDAATGTHHGSRHDQRNDAAVLALAFSSGPGPAGYSLAVASGDMPSQIKGLLGSGDWRFEPLKGVTTALAYSPDGKILYIADATGSARSWDLATHRLIHTFQTAGSKAQGFTIDRQMNSIWLSKDGATLATCGSSINNEYVESLKLWDANTGQLKRDFAAENIHGRPVALSPDGSIIATGGKSVKLWDTATGKPLRELYGHLKRTQSIVFSADGRLVVAGGSYGTTNIWETATGRHLVTLFAYTTSKDGKTNDDWFAYAPDGYYVGSPNAERYLAWRHGDELLTPATLSARFSQPERIEQVLKSAP